MDIKLWLKERIAEETDIAISQISGDQEFSEFNMDSLSTLTLAFDLEALLGIEELDPTVFSEYNTINKLAAWIEQRQK